MKYANIEFIQRNHYNSLLTKDFTNEDILKLVRSQNGKNISAMTLKSIIETNCLIKYVLFKNPEPQLCVSSNQGTRLTKDQEDYIAKEVKDYLTETYDIYEETKCYETVIHPATTDITLLVIVEKGFLSLVTTNPEILQVFYRDLLRHSFGQQANSFMLNREYLGLKMKYGYFDLVKLRLDR